MSRRQSILAVPRLTATGRLPKHRLRFETLEERVVFNATSIDQALAVVAPLTTPVEKLVSNGDDNGREAWAIPAIFSPDGNGPKGPEFLPPYPGQTFSLHSRPSSPRKIYLDFNGHITSGQPWNQAYNNNAPFTLLPFNFEGSGSSFSVNEEERIQRIWQRVAEDYAPFDVDVTTEDPGLAGLTYSGGGDTTWGMRCIITPSDDWIVDNVGGIGGIAYVPSFKSGGDITCYVFSGNLGPNNEGYIAEATSHEVGHTLGLGHDGTSSQGYYGGHNGAGGTPSWAPIMGVGYDRTLVQWSKGEYLDANNSGQDDLAVITNTTENFGYRPDDAGDTIAAATPATINGSALSFTGVIERTTDVDVISFQTATGNVSFTFSPWVNSPNLDIRAELRNAAGTVIASHDPLNSLGATINTVISTQGTYYLVVEGVGVGNTQTTGYSDYASLGQYTIGGTIVTTLRLTDIETTPLTFTENQAALTLTSALIVTPGLDLNRATVSITNYVNGQDVLNFTNQGGITGNFSAATGILTLTGVASPSIYQTALRSVTYSNASNNPSAATRTLVFQLRDTANDLSNTMLRDLNVISVNDQPNLNPIADRNLNEDAGLQTVNLGGINDGGPEGQTLTITAVSDNTAVVPHPTVNYTSPTSTGTLTFTPVPNGFGTANITVTVTDSGGTANGGVNTRQQFFQVIVAGINDAPTFNVGPDLNSPLSGGLRTHPGWATAISPGAVNETGQALTVFMSNDNNALFSVQPALALDGTLTFTAIPGSMGTANVSVYMQDDGGTANGGSDTSTTKNFVINVGVNNAPTLDNSGNPLMAPVAQNSVTPTYSVVGDFAAAGLADPDPFTPFGIAIIGANSPNGIWEYSIDAAQTWLPLTGSILSSARLLRFEDLVRFNPAAGFIGTASLTYHGWDQSTGTPGGTADLSGGGATGGGTAYSVASESALVRVAPAISSILEDGKPAIKKLSALPSSTFGDVDLLPKRGIAIVGRGGQLPGAWQYTTNGRTWKTLAAVDPSTALLLRSTDKVRFVPAANLSGDSYLVYRAWDLTSGVAGAVIDLSSPASVGGNTAFSTGTDFMFATVNAANDNPVLGKGAKTWLTPIQPTNNDPAGDLVSTLLGSLVTDGDPGTVPGLAVTAISKVGGIWQYQLAGDPGWTPMPKVSAGKALLLEPDDRIRFLPDGVTEGTAKFSFKAWDQTSGIHGNQLKTNTSSFSKKVGTGYINVAASATPPANDAPILDNAPVVALADAAEDSKPAGTLISTLLGNSVTDPDGGNTEGIAITGVTGAANGTWQYSLNGRAWKSVGLVSESSALLLTNAQFVRYLPGLNYHGTASMTYRAWDLTTGTATHYADLTLPGTVGGSSSISVAAETATVTVTPVNDSPVLNTLPAPLFTAVPPGATNPAGDTVASILGSALTDVDAGALQGIAVVKAPATHGDWMFQLNGNIVWDTLAGSSSKQPTLLRANDRVRFVPQAGFLGTATISYKGWDQSLGTPGGVGTPADISSMSKKVETAAVTVNAVNDRPVLDNKFKPEVPSVAVNDNNPAGFTVATLLGTAVTDPDSPSLQGIAITGIDTKNGQWAYAIGAGPWLPLLGTSGGLSVLLRSTDKIRFVPNANFSGAAKLSYKAWDQTQGNPGDFLPSTGDAFSKAIASAYVYVNSAPTLTW